MTLKHIAADGREETVELQGPVNFDPARKVLTGKERDPLPDGRDRQWTRGRAFVMNDHGKTVAVYTLNS